MSLLLRVCVLGLALATPLAMAQGQPDPDYDRLMAELRALESDPALGGLAGVERLKARQALAALQAATRRERPHALYMAERRVLTARIAAQAELARSQAEQLDRERDQILLQASQRDAALARQEAERLRLLSLARAEEAQRERLAREQSTAEAEAALAQAEQARRLAEARAREAALARREAELAAAAAESLRLQLESLTSRREERGEVMTLSGDVFAPGQGALRPEARAHLRRVVEFVQRNPGARVRIEGHTDSTGSANLNQSLSQRRAESVRQALIEEGVDAARLEAVGFGQDRPVADNRTEEGRARNRRVEIVVLAGGG